MYTSYSLLKRRHMIDNDRCPWCNDKTETINHALFLCPTAIDLWQESDSAELVCTNEEEDFKELLLRWQGLDEQKRRKGASLIWWVWGRRNEKVPSSLLVRDTVLRLVENHGKYTASHNETAQVPTGRSSRVWKPPPDGIVKVNCDASLSAQGWIGLRVVARDSNGDVVFVGSRRTRGEWPPESLMQECVACGKIG